MVAAAYQTARQKLMTPNHQVIQLSYLQILISRIPSTTLNPKKETAKMAQNDHRGIIPPSHPNSKSVFCLSGSTAILHIKLNSRIPLRGEKFISLAKRNTQQFVTSTVMRRSVTGDAGSLLRLHQFLMDFRLLNGGQIGETAPGDAVLRGLHNAGRGSCGFQAESFQRHGMDVRSHPFSRGVGREACQQENWWGITRSGELGR
jgi:hypothetical protein